MNRLKHEELLEKISSFDASHIDEQKNDIIAAAKQIGFSVPNRNCKCVNGWSDLVIRLKIWMRQHPTPCHFSIQPGIVRRGPDGANVTNLNITDESALWLLENDEVAAKYITQISEMEEPVETLTETPTETPAETADNKEDLFMGDTEHAEPVEVPVQKKKSYKKKKGAAK